VSNPVKRARCSNWGAVAARAEAVYQCAVDGTWNCVFECGRWAGGVAASLTNNGRALPGSVG